MGLLLLTLTIFGLALNAWLFIEIQRKEVVLTKFDKNNDPMEKHFLININILYYIIFFSLNIYECL